MSNDSYEFNGAGIEKEDYFDILRALELIKIDFEYLFDIYIIMMMLKLFIIYR